MENNVKFSKVYYLGPEGSYSDIAKNLFNDFYTEDCEFIEKNSISQIVENLISDKSDSTIAILPIENSVEGIVRETQDKLNKLVENGVYIYAESKLPVSHALIGHALSLDDIKIITSHPQAIAQCREYLNKTFGDNVLLEPALSTSMGIKSLTSNTPEKAAIGNEYCANLNDIPIIEHDINDEKNNTTRFILVCRRTPQNIKNNKVSIVFSTENHSGALNKALSILEKYNINLSYIDSRPSRKELGEYIFYADFSGHIEENNITLALIDLQNQVRTLNILSKGSIVKNK